MAAELPGVGQGARVLSPRIPETFFRPETLETRFLLRILRGG